MAFAVDDFDDLVRLLEERPDWRARLRQVLLPRELLELPAVVAQLVETSRATLGRLDCVEARLDGIDGRLDGVDRRLGRLEGGVQELRGDVGGLKGSVARLHSDNSVLQGDRMEQRYRDRTILFAHLLDDPIPFAPRELDGWLREHVSARRLTQAEAVRIARTDLVFGSSRDGQPAYLLVEVSWSVDVSDVQRAIERAALLRKAAPERSRSWPASGSTRSRPSWPSARGSPG